MKNKLLSAKEFQQLLITNKLPSIFVVEESVSINMDGSMPYFTIINGIFKQDVLFRNLPIQGGIEIKGCLFENDISIEHCDIETHVIIEENIFHGKLFIDTAKIISYLTWKNNHIKKLFVINSSWEYTLVDDYRVARVLELAKQNIYIDLEYIPSF